MKPLLVAVLLLSAAPAQAKLEFQTRTVGIVTAGCHQVGLFVPVRKGRSRRQDNFRTYRFVHPDATKVYVSFIMDTPTGQPVMGTRVRALAENGASALALNDKYGMPFVMNVEGLRASANPNDTGFEFQFYKTDDQGNDVPLCGGSAQGTVVDVTTELDVSAGSGVTLERRRPNVLLTASGTATATVSPSGGVNPTWHYPQDGSQDASFSAQGTFVTPYQASKTFTPIGRRGLDEMVLSLDSGGQVIEAFHALNLTTPRRLKLYASSPDPNQCGGSSTARLKRWDSNVVRANDLNGVFNLVAGHWFCYNMLDQFGQKIKVTAAWGGVVPQVRENIRPLVSSPIPAVQTWIDSLGATPLFETTDAWKPKTDGNISDHVVARGLPNDTVIQVAPGGQRSFIQQVRRKGGILIRLRDPGVHIWQVTLDQTPETTVDMTSNRFFSVVEGVNPAAPAVPTEIFFRTTYEVRLNQN